MLGLFVKGCLPWVGPHTGAGKECEEEGAAETMRYELITTPVPLGLHSSACPEPNEMENIAFSRISSSNTIPTYFCLY